MNPPDATPPTDRDLAWERRLHVELRRLPTHEAPASLVPDVMAAIRARETVRIQSWWRRPATTWHPVLRVAFGVVALSTLGALIIGARLVGPEMAGSSVAQTVTALGVDISALLSAIHTVVEALLGAAASVLTPTRAAILAAVVLAQVIVLGLGSSALRSLLRAPVSET